MGSSVLGHSPVQSRFFRRPKSRTQGGTGKGNERSHVPGTRPLAFAVCVAERCRYPGGSQPPPPPALAWFSATPGVNPPISALSATPTDVGLLFVVSSGEIADALPRAAP